MKCRLKSMTTFTALVLSAVLLVGCGADEVVESTTDNNTETEASSGEYIAEGTTEYVTEIETTIIQETTTETVTETETEPVTEPSTETKTEAPTEASTEAPTQKATETPTTQAPKPTEKTTEKVTEKQTERATEKATKPTEAPTKKEETTTSYWAMQEDAPAIAAKVIEYINAYRVKEGTFKLVQGTKEMQAFADLRSQQLVTNFAHDDDDTLAAVKQLNYGEFWSDGYYQAYNGSTEAISLSFTSGEIDEVAKSIADGFYGSKNHWYYLGNVDNKNSEYKYIAVGLTYYKTFWYCAVWIDAEQHTVPIYYN